MPPPAPALGPASRSDPGRRFSPWTRLGRGRRALARLELSLVLDGGSAAIANAPDSAKDDVSLRTATLVYDDASLFAKLVPGASGNQPEAPRLEDPKAFLAALPQDLG